MLEDFRGLSPKLKERANRQMETLQAEVDDLRRKVEDLRIPWGNLTAELLARKVALANAMKSLRKDGDGRQKTEALRAVIAEIRCHFRHTVLNGQKRTGQNGKQHNGKSFLEKVEIVPVAGNVYMSFMDGNRPGPVPTSEGRINVLQAALTRRYERQEIASFCQCTAPGDPPQHSRLEAWKKHANRS